MWTGIRGMARACIWQPKASAVDRAEGLRRQRTSVPTATQRASADAPSPTYSMCAAQGLLVACRRPASAAPAGGWGPPAPPPVPLVPLPPLALSRRTRHTRRPRRCPGLSRPVARALHRRLLVELTAANAAAVRTPPQTHAPPAAACLHREPEHRPGSQATRDRAHCRLHPRRCYCRPCRCWLLLGCRIGGGAGGGALPRV